MKSWRVVRQYPFVGLQLRGGEERPDLFVVAASLSKSRDDKLVLKLVAQRKEDAMSPALFTPEIGSLLARLVGVVEFSDLVNELRLGDHDPSPWWH